MKLELDWLKENYTKIHYFGLGFIQLKLNQYDRVHFYTKELPQIVGLEEVHNHRYDFRSTVIRGRLTQEIFRQTQGNYYTIEDESCQENVKPECCPPTLCDLLMTSVHTYGEGCHYFINHDTFHRVIADNCVTLVQRTDYKKKYAKVIRPVGAQKVCPFSQKVEESKLWEIIEVMCKPTASAVDSHSCSIPSGRD